MKRGEMGCPGGDGHVGARDLDRRGFVARLPLLAGAAAGALELGACGGAPYLRPRRMGDRLAVESAAVGPDGVFVAHPTGDRPIYLSRVEGEDPVAVLARCTHRGCQPEPVVGRLVCPCHGSEFTRSGDVLEGPARDSLHRFRVTVEGTETVIWLERGNEGASP